MELDRYARLARFCGQFDAVGIEKVAMPEKTIIGASP
ncbi:hypothetical protein ACVWYH_005987 [Bradyrhizobium sp. GM24.11]